MAQIHKTAKAKAQKGLLSRGRHSTPTRVALTLSPSLGSGELFLRHSQKCSKDDAGHGGASASGLQGEWASEPCSEDGQQ